ncbi:hypothetical protein H6P81_016724 [Aristolochia fimbriata]|uniref:AAA+ ATPase domain-containing protein n=1 Tax=Aristolochia fimbriata TaxID=158543 RepID=A0AAV7E9I7_ARIFI|nr:hypothetical protein H6P81_016724 [Aristolochia fimbriata]
MEILVELVVQLGKGLYVPFKRHCGYLCFYAKNVKELEDEVELLQTQREDMNKKLDEESRSNMTPQQAVKKWKGSADKVVEEAEMLSRHMKEEQRCLMGWCPNLRWRHEVGKKASKQLDQVQKLKENGDRFLGSVTICHPRPPPDVEEIRLGDKYVATTVMEQVMDALGDDNVRSIGIHGMGGIGKTTLVKNINNRLKGSRLFDKVIFVTVSQNQNMNVIQDQITERLGMKLDLKDWTTTGINYSRANRLLEMLKKLKSVLIILDDVWTELKVVELGLPSKNEHECCKIIVTTRNREVCLQMGMDKEFEMKPLSYELAWALFESKVGDVLKNEKLLKEVGEDIVKECGGSPLAIVTLGSTLAHEEDGYVWRDALSRLKSSEPTQLDGIISQVITSIEFSYDHLRDQGMKFCFLFCSLFPEDYEINLDDLRIFGIGEGFLHVRGNCLEAKVQLMAYIKRLKNCSLLLEGYRRNHVKLHDVVRLTALSIASKEGQGFIEKTRLGLTHWPRLDNEEECKRLSLIENYYIKLPDSSNFPQLRTLLLKDCLCIRHIPNNFFVGMHALVNLDLSGTVDKLDYWPQSISSLTNLRSLILSYPWASSKKQFFHIDDLSKLKNLEVLKAISGEVSIPVEFAKLSNLKILNLNEVHLEMIPANVISRLHNLEELYLNIRQNRQYFSRGADEIRSAASLVEVAALKRLTVLEVRVREEEVFFMPNNGWGHELQEFKIVFGNNSLDYDVYKSAGNTLVLGKLPEQVPQWVICLIKKVECLHLKWRPDLKKVLYLDTLTTLKQMEISNCSTILQIANTEEEEEEEAPLSISVLGRLEKLNLIRLSNLENIICQGRAQYLNITQSFVMNLKVLEVEHCCKLVNLLPPNLLQALQLLERLKVKHCMAMRRIFVTSTTTDQGSSSISANYDLETRNCLEHLVELHLEDMPNLVRICDGHVPDRFLKNLKRVTIRNCGKLTPDIFAQDLVHCIENIEIILLENFSSYLSIETILLRLGRPGSIHLFQNLTSLSIGKCPTLKSICSFDSTSSTGSTSPIAYSQDVYSCHHEHHFLPQLRDLRLVDLPNLVNICDGPGCFGSQLVNVNVEGCGKLETIFSLSNMVRHGFRNLQELSVINCVKMKAIFIVKEEEEEVVPPILLESCLLPQLRRLRLEDLPELLSFCSWDRFHLPISNSLLRHLHMVNCPKLGNYIHDQYQEPHHDQSIQRREQYEADQAPNHVLVLFGNAAISNPNSSYFPMMPLLGIEYNLTQLIVGDLSEIQHVFCLEKEVEEGGGGGNIKCYSIFTKLEYLSLHRLEKLNSLVWTGSNSLNIGSSSFQNLRELQVGDCNSLRYLFSPLVAKHLLHLKYLHVKSCKRLEKLILISDGEEEITSAAGRIWTTAIKDVLPQLRDLYLDYLPELTSVFSVETIFLQFPSLKTIHVSRCSKLKQLSLGPNSSPLLKEIKGTQEWLQALEEDMTMEMKSRFKSLFKVDDESDDDMEEVERAAEL